MSTDLFQSDPNQFQPLKLTLVQPAIPAAQYVRMSTELQCYSTQNQMAAIAKYAEGHGMVIVRTFADEGKSGLTLNQRAGLRELLTVVQQGHADFRAILVYDVSRWGRFQDVEESSYWEHVCKRAGVQIHYCAELFPNDGSFISIIIKNLKRTMAAEYSRELSVKCFAGLCRIVEMGFHHGGPTGYGLRRLLVDAKGRPKGILQPGEAKYIQSDHVIQVPGPEQEQRIVREIYHSLVNEGKSQKGIANDLNSRGIPNGLSRPWCYSSVHEILVNPKYIGTSVYNRKSVKLRSPAVRNPKELWICKEGAFEPIVSRELFEQAAQILEERRRRPTDGEMLDHLRSLLATKGRITGALIDSSGYECSSSAFFLRFGGLRKAYEKLSYDPTRNLSFVESNGPCRALARKLLDEVKSRLEAIGAHLEFDCKTRILTVNGTIRVRLNVIRCVKPKGQPIWWLVKRWSACDVVITARLNETNTDILDYFVIPASLHPRKRLTKLKNPIDLDVYRFDTLDQICRLCRRKRA